MKIEFCRDDDEHILLHMAVDFGTVPGRTAAVAAGFVRRGFVVVGYKYFAEDMGPVVGSIVVVDTMAAAKL